RLPCLSILPYTTCFRSPHQLEGWQVTEMSLPAGSEPPQSSVQSPQNRELVDSMVWTDDGAVGFLLRNDGLLNRIRFPELILEREDRKSTRLNSSHVKIS